MSCFQQDELCKPYITFNPCMLNDPSWAYRDLQLLSMRLGLGGKGNKRTLIQRLKKWHRIQFDQERSERGSNFSWLEVKIDSQSSIPARLLSPLIDKPRLQMDGSPVGILSRTKGKSANRKRKSLSFSVFNGVKLIPSRVSLQQIRKKRNRKRRTEVQEQENGSEDEEEEEKEERIKRRKKRRKIVRIRREEKESEGKEEDQDEEKNKGRMDLGDTERSRDRQHDRADHPVDPGPTSRSRSPSQQDR